ncbi:hypothetical protein OAM01_00380 [bacterium]|nr:hypothetical protein [bacterium]
MSTFKFLCPDCDVHIETEASSVGCIVECPQCSEELVIPAFHPNMVTMPLAARSKHAHGHQSAQKTSAFESSVPSVDFLTPLDQEGIEEAVSNVPVHDALKTHVGVLSADIKLEVVRWAFRRIEHPAAWMRHRKQGARYVYAGIRKGAGIEPVSYDHPDAVRFTLLGAILLELKIQNVSMSAEGREEFLDREIVDISRKVLVESSVEPESSEPMGVLNHEQCLSVLRQLEAIYLGESEHLDEMMESARLPGVTMSDLVKRAEQGTIVTSNEVLSVLYHETHVLNRRIEELEKLIKTRLS